MEQSSGLLSTVRSRLRPIQSAQRDMFACLMQQDEALVKKGFPPLTPWWRGTLEKFYGAHRRRGVWRVGRKGTKSSTMCRVAVNEVLNGAHIIRPGDIGLFPFLSENVREAKDRLFTIKEILKALNVEIEPHEGDILVVHRKIAFGVRAARVGSVSGPCIVGFVADEEAKWRDEDTGQNPATEVLRSLRPATVTQPYAHEFHISSPWSTTDIHHEMVSAGNTAEQYVDQAPSWVANPTITEAFTRELESDIPTWNREYAAIPMSAGETTFFDHRAVEAAVDKTLVMPCAPRIGHTVTAGGDLAFEKDSAALAFVHRDGDWMSPHTTYRLAEFYEERPTDVGPIKPSELLARYAERMKFHQCSTLMADGHYRMTAVECLEQAGLQFANAPEGQKGKNETYVRARVLLHSGRVRIPNDARLIRQFKEVLQKPVGTGISVFSPRKKGDHGDLVSCVVLALWQKGGDLIKGNEIKFGTREYWARLRSPEYLQEEEDRRVAEEEEEILREDRERRGLYDCCEYYHDS